jgi:membrane protease YdiL (CAAX protease family)
MTIGTSSSPYEARTPWPALWAVAATFAIYAAGVVALTSILSLDDVVRGTGRAQGLWRRDAATLLTMAVWQLATVALTLVASAMLGGRMRDVLALQAPAGGFKQYALGIALTIAAEAAIWLVGLWLQPETSADQSSTLLFGNQWWLALLVVGIGAPFAEELLFRGFLLSALAKTWLGFWSASLISTTWWTLLHAGTAPANFLAVFPMGLLYSWQLRRSGSLRVPIVCHAVYNILIIVVFGQLKL